MGLQAVMDAKDTARFWAKVDRRDSDECWLWTACLRNGYGAFWTGSRNDYAHRVSYQLLVGAIPAELVIDHLCRTPRCVNPAHMELVSRGENVRRGEAGFTTGAKNRAKTHCRNGHAFDEMNTRINKDGSRTCRTCGRLSMRRRRARNRAEGSNA